MLLLLDWKWNDSSSTYWCSISLRPALNWNMLKISCNNPLQSTCFRAGETPGAGQVWELAAPYPPNPATLPIAPPLPFHVLNLPLRSKAACYLEMKFSSFLKMPRTRHHLSGRPNGGSQLVSSTPRLFLPFIFSLMPEMHKERESTSVTWWVMLTFTHAVNKLPISYFVPISLFKMQIDIESQIH